MRAVVPFSDLGIATPVIACCYCAPDDLGGFIDVTAHDAHMINLQAGCVDLTLVREGNSYFWNIIGVEPAKGGELHDLNAAAADARV